MSYALLRNDVLDGRSDSRGPELPGSARGDDPGFLDPVRYRDDVGGGSPVFETSQGSGYLIEAVVGKQPLLHTA